MQVFKKSILLLILFSVAACSKSSAPFVPTPGVVVLPSVISLGAGETQLFEATIVNTTTTVIWSVDGGDENGTIDQNGLYTAPATINPENPTAVVRASLANNTSTQDTAEVDLVTAE